MHSHYPPRPVVGTHAKSKCLQLLSGKIVSMTTTECVVVIHYYLLVSKNANKQLIYGFKIEILFMGTSREWEVKMSIRRLRLWFIEGRSANFRCRVVWSECARQWATYSILMIIQSVSFFECAPYLFNLCFACHSWSIMSVACHVKLSMSRHRCRVPCHLGVKDVDGTSVCAEFH